MNDTAIAQTLSPPQEAWTPPVTPPAEPPDPFETSSWLTQITGDTTWLGSARRAGFGLVLTLPFMAVVSMRSSAPASALVMTSLSIPVGLAMIALVGIAASTLGISLVSAPVAPEDAADVASRGLFRAGLLLAGLTPLTALWVASGDAERVIAPTLVLFAAGATGIGTIARDLVRRAAAPNGDARVGSVLVALLFSLFAFVVGLRLWAGSFDTLLSHHHGGSDDRRISAPAP